MSGPLSGIKVIEMLGIGPGPMAGMLLADMGAEVTVIARPGGISPLELEIDITRRGKRWLELDLKSEAGRADLLELLATADAIFEGYRPGVMERLGLGPDDLAAVNPALVYGRITGWGQDGPLAPFAGHDINYAAIAGALYSMGPVDAPPPVPLNLVADYGGGALFLTVGLLAAILEARSSGKGQVVDAAMTEGTSLMMAMFHSLRANGLWQDARQANFLDGGAPYYGAYATRDGRFVALGAIEPQFFAEFARRMGLGPEWIDSQEDCSAWPGFRAELARRFATETQAHWVAVFAESDACLAPVLPFWEAHAHPQHVARGAFVEQDGLRQPAPSPRFSRTPSRAGRLPGLDRHPRR